MNMSEQIAELKQKNEELENYFRNTIIPQLFIDRDLILRKFSPAAMKQFTLTSDDINKSINHVINNMRFPSIVENINYVIDTAEILEKEIQTTDMSWYQMNILPYLARLEDKPNGVIITFVDITRRIEDLVELEKLISDYESLLDSISHDVKTPLTSLLLSIEMLTDGSSPDAQDTRSILKIVANGIAKLQSILNELTETRKEDQYKYKAYDELINVEHIIEDVRLALIDNINATGTVITTELDVSEIFFSRRKLRSIIFNLVNNAIKFRAADRKPEINIRTWQDGDLIVISVSDNGIGIDEEMYTDIFDKYYRVNNHIEGSGIGLHLVKELITNAGGEIEVNSRKGEGTAFKIYLKTRQK